MPTTNVISLAWGMHLSSSHRYSPIAVAIDNNSSYLTRGLPPCLLCFFAITMTITIILFEKGIYHEIRLWHDRVVPHRNERLWM